MFNFNGGGGGVGGLVFVDYEVSVFLFLVSFSSWLYLGCAPLALSNIQSLC